MIKSKKRRERKKYRPVKSVDLIAPLNAKLETEMQITNRNQLVSGRKKSH